jgi:DNA-binding protein Alba
LSEKEQKPSGKPEVESGKEADVKEEAEKKEMSEKKEESHKPSSKANNKQNVVYIGNKPPMNYVMAVITAFNMGNGTEVTLKARGRAISTAVDVAEITRSRFLREAKVQAISIGTEEVPSREDGRPRNVSTMEISLKN